MSRLRVILALLLLIATAPAPVVINSYRYAATSAPIPPTANLVQWMDATNGPDTTVDEAAVSSVTDRSGSGNTLANTGSNRPTYEVAGINGLASLEFNGSNQYLQTALSVSGDVTIYAVVQYAGGSTGTFRSWAGMRGTTGGNFDAMLAGNNGNTTHLFRWAYGDGSSALSAGPGGTIVTGTPDVITVQKSGNTNVSLWVNGTLIGSGSVAQTALVADLFVLGSGHYNNAVVDPFQGLIGEELAYTTAHGSVTRGIVEYYLGQKWSAAVPEFAASTMDADDGALGSITADLNNDGKAEWARISPSAATTPKFQVYGWDSSSETHTLVKNVLSSATVAALQDRFGTELESADMDGDGLKDLVAVDSSNSGNAGTCRWWKNPGGNLSGTWTEATIATFSGSGTGNQITHAELELGDIDGDGDQDVAIRDISHGVWVVENTGSGATWGTPKFTATDPRECLALGDMDGDGDLDLWLNGFWLETPSSISSGTYTLHAIVGAEGWKPGGSSSDQIADYAVKGLAIDLNGDGKLDAVYSNAEMLNNAAGSASKPLGIRAYLQPADRINDTWTEVTLIATNRSWHNLRAADLDGDGDQDIVSGIAGVGGEGATGRITKFLNNYNGTPGSTPTFSTVNIETGTLVYGLTLGDANGDGKIDIFAPGNWNSSANRLLRHR